VNSQEEIEYLKRRGDLFCDFLVSKSGSLPSIQDFKTIFIQLYLAADLTGLRQMNDEVTSWSRNLPTEQDSIEFWKLLKSEFGEDYPSAYTKRIKRIKRKGVQSEFEYRLIEDHVNDLCQNGDADLEIRELDGLLTNFEVKSKPNI